MDSRMAILTEVQFRHGYFRNGLCPCLSAVPSDNSLRVMMNHGLLLKTKPGGLRLLYDTKHAGGLRSVADVLRKGLVIRVLLYLEDPYFYNYTSPLPIPTDRQVLYFTNRPGRPFLHKEKQVSGSDLFESPLPFKRPFAILALRLYPGRLEKDYHIFFQARSARWNYILVGNHLKELHAPAILHADKKQTFTGPSSIDLPDGRTGLSFISQASIELREPPAGACTLVEDFDPATVKYKVVIPTLPVPDTRIISRAHSREDHTDLCEIFLY